MVSKMILLFLLIISFINYGNCQFDIDETLYVLKNPKLLINKQCKDDMTLLYEDLKAHELWAIQMTDASGKIPSGRQVGNLNSLGYFDACLDVKGPNNIEGKYCTAFTINAPSIIGASGIPIIPGISKANSNSSTFGYWGLCRPSSCSAEDLNLIHIKMDIALGTVFAFSDLLCQTKATEPEFTGGDIAVSVFLLCVLLIIIVSTGYDVYLNYKKKEPISDLCLSFSFLTNSRKLFHISNDPRQLPCLGGLRSISMMWVILGHFFSTKLYLPLANPEEVQKFSERPTSMYIFGASVAVDTFFLLSGMLMVYIYLKSRQMKLLDIPMYYVHRYLRLTPSIAILLVIHLTLLKHIGNGPVWPLIKSFMVDNCEKYWYTLLLYVQNYVNADKPCLSQTWYLSVDMQLFLLSPLILIPLKKYTNHTLMACSLCIVVSTAISFYVGWEYHLLLIHLEVPAEDKITIMEKYYTVTHTRANVWLMGVILGYVVYRYKNNEFQFKISTFKCIVLWILSLTLLATCVFGAFNLLTDDGKVKNTFYVAFLRPAWAFGLCWVIFACISGYGGPIDKFLSWPIFQLIAKVSYTMYILHPSIIQLIFGSKKVPRWFTEQNELYEYWSAFMTVFFFSIVWTLAFESPVIALERRLRGTQQPKIIQKETKKVDLEQAEKEGLSEEKLEGKENQAFQENEELNETEKRLRDDGKNV